MKRNNQRSRDANNKVSYFLPAFNFRIFFFYDDQFVTYWNNKKSVDSLALVWQMAAI